MVSYKEKLEDFVDSLITIGADNLTLDLIRDLIKGNPKLFTYEIQRSMRVAGIEQTLKERESCF